MGIYENKKETCTHLSTSRKQSETKASASFSAPLSPILLFSRLKEERELLPEAVNKKELKEGRQGVYIYSKCCRQCRPGRSSHSLGRALGPFSGPSLEGKAIRMITTIRFQIKCKRLHFIVTHSNSSLCNSLTAGTPPSKMESGCLELSMNTTQNSPAKNIYMCVCTCVCGITCLTAFSAYARSPALRGALCGTPVWLSGG